MNRRPTPVEIEHIIQQAQRERSRVLGEYLARGFHAIGRAFVAAYNVIHQGVAMSGVRSPAALKLRLREYERNQG